MKKSFLILCFFIVFLSANNTINSTSNYTNVTTEVKNVWDPLSGYNRLMYGVNDVFYTYLVTPVATGYDFIMPDFAQTGISNFFKNILYPMRLINNLLQGEGGYAWDETKRFLVNTTIGIGGLFDPATSLGIEPHYADFGQTLGVWGIGEGPYIVWPLIGPSSLRGTFGIVGDAAANPVNYMYTMKAVRDRAAPIYINGGFMLNDYSLKPDQYIKFKENCKGRDCYIYQRDQYIQRRRNLINKNK